MFDEEECVSFGRIYSCFFEDINGFFEIHYSSLDLLGAEGADSFSVSISALGLKSGYSWDIAHLSAQIAISS